jgi:hypothetical protein
MEYHRIKDKNDLPQSAPRSQRKEQSDLKGKKPELQLGKGDNY